MKIDLLKNMLKSLSHLLL